MKEMKRVASTPERMKKAMELTQKKQIDLSKETGLSHSTISRYLSGQVEPRQAAMMQLASALNVSEMWLWGYDVPMARPGSEKPATDTGSGLSEKKRAFMEEIMQMSDEDFDRLVQIRKLLETK